MDTDSPGMAPGSASSVKEGHRGADGIGKDCVGIPGALLSACKACKADLSSVATCAAQVWVSGLDIEGGVGIVDMGLLAEEHASATSSVWVRPFKERGLEGRETVT